MRVASVALLSILLPLPVAADVVFDHKATETCLALGGDQAQCIGASASMCMEQSEGGGSTAGMGGCLWAEHDYWDQRLNASYARAMAQAQTHDADLDINGEPSSRIADGLRAMQRAWIPFRDAACDYERALWMGGTGGGPATAQCMMQLTAQQTLRIEGRIIP